MEPHIPLSKRLLSEQVKKVKDPALSVEKTCDIIIDYGVACKLEGELKYIDIAIGVVSDENKKYWKELSTLINKQLDELAAKYNITIVKQVHAKLN